MRKILLIVCATIFALNVNAQTVSSVLDNGEYQNGTTIYAKANAGIGDMLKAFGDNFGGEFMDAFNQYLKNKDAYNNSMYYIDYAPQNGYAKIDMAVQYSNYIESCYWKRTNGHKLLAIYVYESGEGDYENACLLFYDYNPATNAMEPDLNLYEKFVPIVEKGYSIKLPKTGKNIIYGFYNKPQKTATWTGMNFNF
ncbi:MAG: hypothetical protein MJ211_04035 [Bacteroidales bacterium]|nr:hypothetical protein [Bacteroidales bacterium]